MTADDNSNTDEFTKANEVALELPSFELTFQTKEKAKLDRVSRIQGVQDRIKVIREKLGDNESRREEFRQRTLKIKKRLLLQTKRMEMARLAMEKKKLKLKKIPLQLIYLVCSMKLKKI